MKTVFRLCRSIVKRSKGFTAGLFVMSVLSVAIAFLGANFSPSADDTVMNFINESGIPDVVYTTGTIPES